MEDKRACLGVGSPCYLHMYPRNKIQNSKQVKQVPLPTEPSILPQITFVYLLSIYFFEAEKFMAETFFY